MVTCSLPQRRHGGTKKQEGLRQGENQVPPAAPITCDFATIRFSMKTVEHASA